MPKWGERIFKGKSVFIVEESIVDPVEKTIVTYTRNIGYTKFMVKNQFLDIFLKYKIRENSQTKHFEFSVVKIIKIC